MARVVVQLLSWALLACLLLVRVDALGVERDVELMARTMGSVDNASLAYSAAWRTGFHFQPRKNWMNDPNGPMYYKGYYHLFYQYDPFSALWGNITWGHAVSTDLVHWKYLDDATIQGGPGWYDIRGAWSGSATFMEDGSPAMMYTGWSNVSDAFQIQTQNLVVPMNSSDPLLRYWVKSDQNPVIVADSTMNASNFRDPTTGWHGKDGDWRILVGGKEPDGGGTTYVYKSKDFSQWTYSHKLHIVPGTGMWECPDLFPVAVSATDMSPIKEGLQGDIISNETGNGTMAVKHIVKVSLDNKKHDYYTIGMYDEANDTFQPDDPELDVGIGLRYDYGKFYASKTFFDQETNRRILFGWINESTSDENAVMNGWSGLQGIPRQLWMDPRTGKDLIQMPIEEIDSLHYDKVSKTEFNLTAGTVVPIAGVYGAQLDIQVKFYKPELGKEDLLFDGTDTASLTAQQICSQMGASQHGQFGPFGLIVLADGGMMEQTAIYFYLMVASMDRWTAILCSDNSRSSLQNGTDKTSYGNYVPVLKSDKYLSLRTIVDHSIVESFVQGGRATVTSRVYPTLATNDAAQFYLFNNGTSDIGVHSFNAWKMANVDIVQFGG